jgi:wyosine [tRNA(Phe)-imidazoG37] synthetase (radical SAM superfamily)/DNA-binding transcriptional ArsR family regulator
VDLAPFKRCTYDCIYCQLGRTTDRTVTPQPYAVAAEVGAEVARRLAEGPRPEVISLAGSGEPTLDPGIGAVIEAIKGVTDLPVAVLTNGSLLWRPEVRDALMAADLVLPSLDAGDEALFQYVNRPHPELSFARVIDGLADFVRLYRGPVWLDVFLLAGGTAMPGEIRKIDACLRRIGPSRVQLNTVTRPPAESFAYAISPERLEGLGRRFSREVEVVGSGALAPAEALPGGGSPAGILDLLARRPCTLEDLAAGLALRPAEVLKHLDGLCRAGAVTLVHRPEGRFYRQTDRWWNKTGARQSFLASASQGSARDRAGAWRPCGPGLPAMWTGFATRREGSPPVALKRDHSQRVAENARTIAAAMGWPEEEQRLAEGSGWLHDVGRFPQFARYGSFADKATVDHGSEGRRVLEGEALVWPARQDEREALLEAVACHNRKEGDLPQGREPDRERLLKLLRDADKLDILEVILHALARDGFQHLPAMLPGGGTRRQVSRAVLEEMRRSRSVSIARVKTLGDFLLLVAAWFYDFNTAPARRLAQQREVLSRLRQALPDRPEVRALLAEVEAATREGCRREETGDRKGETMGDGREVLQEAWSRREGPAVFSTADERGVPNAIYCTFVKLLTDGRIVVADNYFHKTRENIGRAAGSVLFSRQSENPSRPGPDHLLTSGPSLRRCRGGSMPSIRVAAAVLEVEELYAAPRS